MAVGLELQAFKFPLQQEHLADFGDQRRYCAADDLDDGQRPD
jgi:hypothetical protein